MSAPGGTDGEEERLRKVTNQAIRRLDVLEYGILATAALLALVAGWLVAYLVAAATTLPMGGTWIVASLFFFVVPGALAWWSNRERQAAEESGSPGQTDSSHQ